MNWLWSPLIHRKVEEILDWATSHDVQLRLARVKTKVKELLQREGIIDRLGESRICGNVYEAAADQIPDAPEPQAASV